MAVASAAPMLRTFGTTALASEAFSFCDFETLAVSRVVCRVLRDLIRTTPGLRAIELSAPGLLRKVKIVKERRSPAFPIRWGADVLLLGSFHGVNIRRLQRLTLGEDMRLSYSPQFLQTF